MIVRCRALINAFVYDQEISVKNIVRVHLSNVIIGFRVAVVGHRVQQNNVHAMQQHVNVILTYVHNVAQTISLVIIMNQKHKHHVHVIMLLYNVVYINRYY